MKLSLWKKLLFVLCLACSLQGCVVLTGAAVGAAATSVIYDRRNIKATLQDQDTSAKISDQLNANANIQQQCHLNVDTYRGTVLLTGQAPTPDLKDQAKQIAKSGPNVNRVYNEITIEAPTSTLTRASDTWITTKIKTEFLATKDLKSGQFKVITENGIVYLMGIVTKSQAEMAVNIARRINGVQKVVKVFTYKRPTATSQATDNSAVTVQPTDQAAAQDTSMPVLDDKDTAPTKSEPKNNYGSALN